MVLPTPSNRHRRMPRASWLRPFAYYSAPPFIAGVVVLAAYWAVSR